MTVSSVTLDEVQAAEDEGLRAIDPRSNELRLQWIVLNDQKKLIEAQMSDVRDELGATLVAEGSQGLTLDGKVVVRLSNVTTISLDTSRLKKDVPQLFSELMKTFAKVTRSERMTIK